MKRFIIILVALFVLAAVGMPVTWWIARSMAAPVPYQYATFRGPAGTESGFFNFKPGDLRTNDDDGEFTCESGHLDKILDQAHASAGYDYFSSAGDTVILRRAALTDPSNPLTHRTNLWVYPFPPGADEYSVLRSGTLGRVKPKN
jgi:hypothetical protein